MGPLTEKEKAELRRRHDRQLEIEREMKGLDPEKDKARLDALLLEWENHEYVINAL